MPKLLERLTSQLQAKNYSKSSAYAIATSQLQKRGHLKKGTQQLTPAGAKRQAMGAEGRAKDRAADYSKGKHSASEYKYSKKTNMATLKSGRGQ